MNSIFFLLLVVVILLISGPWLIQRIYTRARHAIKIPELNNFPAEERGRIWLESICETLMQWQFVLGFVLLLAVGGSLIIALGDRAPEQWVTWSVLFALVLAMRPVIVRRARAVLSSKLNVSKNTSSG
ncbi:MAG: hypothetical protein OEQ39_14930 [Gammaproteobacteria bacterium]|nr:hypothetical protein [Gammaproteobacteria bacterium]